MKSSKLLQMLVVLVCLSSFLSAEPYKSDSNTVVLAHFDETVVGSIAIQSFFSVPDAIYDGVNPMKALGKKGRYGNGVELMGDDYVSVPWIADFESTSKAITVEAWVRITESGQDNPPFIFRESCYDLRVEPDDRLNFWINGVSSDVDGRTKLNVDTWYHVAGVYDGKSIKVYLDGVLDGEASATGAHPTDTTSPIMFGFDKAYTRYLKGIIDEVRVSNIARSAEDFDKDAVKKGRAERRPRSRRAVAAAKTENRSRLEWITEQTIEPVWGMGTHERYHPEELPLLENLGVQLNCLSYGWEEVEHEKGKFVWGSPPNWWGFLPAKMTIEEYLTESKRRGFGLSWLLQLGTWKTKGTPNGWYLTPAEQATITRSKKIQDVYGTSETFQEAFAEYCYQAVREFGSNGLDLVHDWELWGEPNSSHPDRIAAGKTYMRFIKRAVERMREADPKAQIGGPNLSRIDIIFLTSCLEEGLADIVDAITFHPYREWTFPEDSSNIAGLNIPDFMPTYLDSTIGGLSLPTYADEIVYLRKLVKKYSKGTPPELRMTEFGVQTRHQVANVKVTDQTQAKYLARFCIQNLALGIEQILWYHLRDYGSDGYGLMSNNAPKSAYFAFKHIIALFDGKMKVLPRLMESKEHINNLHQYFFVKADGELLICFWQAMKAAETYQGTKAEFTFTDPILAEYKKCRLYNPLLDSDQYFEYTLKGNTLKASELKVMDYPMILRLTK